MASEKENQGDGDKEANVEAKREAEGNGGEKKRPESEKDPAELDKAVKSFVPSKRALTRRIDNLIVQGQNLGHDLMPKEITVEEDPNLTAIGQKFFEENIFAFFACALSGLLALMYVPSIIRVLKATGKSSNAIAAFDRYLSTLNHMMQWYRTSPERRLSLRKVRQLHAKASLFCASRHGQAMTQYDMVVTQWAFVGPAFVFPQDLGLGGASDSELNGLRHNMYLIGHLLGIRDDFNLCSGDLQETRAYARDIHRKIIIPGLERYCDYEHSKAMAKHLLDGISLINPLIVPEAFEAWTFKVLKHSDWMTKVEKDVTNTKAKFLFWVKSYVFEQLIAMNYVGGIFKLVVNFLLKLNIACANYLKEDIKRDFSKQQVNCNKGWFETLKNIVVPVWHLSCGGVFFAYCGFSFDKMQIAIQNAKVSKSKTLGQVDQAARGKLKGDFQKQVKESLVDDIESKKIA